VDGESRSPGPIALTLDVCQFVVGRDFSELELVVLCSWRIETIRAVPPADPWLTVRISLDENITINDMVSRLSFHSV
jgi:hypothetical protein